MKNFFLILVMIVVQQQVISQETFNDEFKYKAIYELTYQPDSTDIESKKIEDMFLYIGNETSRFSSAGKAIGDSLQSAFDYSNFNQAAFTSMRNQIPGTEFKYYIYKGLPAEKITYVKEIVQDKYYYTDSKNQFNWKILEEIDTIAGYRVQKATTSFAGRDYTAWFTQEIPFTEGPYKFNGLPGLILKIGDEKEHYVFELTQIQELKDTIPFSFQEKELIEISSEKLLKLEEEYKKDPIAFTQRSVPGLKIQYGEDADQKRIERERKEKLKKQNNPLEIK